MDHKPASALSIQQLVGAAERLRRRDKVGTAAVDWLQVIESTRERLSVRPFVAQPLDAFFIEEKGKRRQVAAPRAGDRLIQEAMLPELNRLLEPMLRDSVHGYRPGRSTFTAAVAASRAVASGACWLALLDIADFYGSIDRALLRQRLEMVVDATRTDMLVSLIEAPCQLAGDFIRTDRGLPLGQPVSPWLANLYLTPLDDAMCLPDVAYLRYGDDLLIGARTEEARNSAERVAEAALAQSGLRLRPEKAERIHLAGDPFLYLGHAVDARGIYERIGGERLKRIERRASAPAPAGSPMQPHQQPNRRSHTLYIVEPGVYVSVHRGLMCIRRGKEVLREIPLHRVDRVMVLAGVALSSGFISSCIHQDVPVVFFVDRGRSFGSLVSGGMPNPLRLRAQYDLLADGVRRLSLARQVVEAKLLAMLRRLANVAGAAVLRDRITALHVRLGQAETADELRGFEGAATRVYYESLALRIKHPGFAFAVRSKRPPRDPINSMLSFAYSLLFSEMQTSLLAHGLDPCPSLLHDLRHGHPALASDLVEPYRVLIADSFVLSLVNKGQVAPAGFETQLNGGVYMTAETRRAVLARFEEWMCRPAGGARGTGSPRRLIHAAARAMLGVVTAEAATLVLPLVDSAIDDASPTEVNDAERDGV